MKKLFMIIDIESFGSLQSNQQQASSIKFYFLAFSISIYKLKVLNFLPPAELNFLLTCCRLHAHFKPNKIIGGYYAIA